VTQLPVFCSKGTFLAEFPHKVIEDHGNQVYAVFDLTKVPVINRAKVEAISLDKFATTVSELEVLKADQKYINWKLKELGGSEAKIQGMIEKYGAEAAAWLSSIGVRDYGFGEVGTTTAAATDEYISVQVNYKIKGLSSLPAVPAVQTKIDAGKNLTVSDSLIKNSMRLGSLDKDGLEAYKEGVVSKKRDLERDMAAMVYSWVLGRVWFNDTDTASTTIELLPGVSSVLTVDKERKSVKV
jgi:hypothetical protein